MADETPIFPAVQKLQQWNASALLDWKHERGELAIIIDRTRIAAACELLKSQAGFDLLSDITAVDWYPAEPRFEVVYHLYSVNDHDSVRLKVKVPEATATVDSVTSVWPAASWYEREIFDLFGVRFNQHPDLRRIMMPDDWEGHPLRKDYPVEGYR